ncbi:uncharacterized protein CANTADRAFT_24565 [Suhomyces tanzawaensis NRRL Y-17324]|uniref:MADS-box domain-containing protein n=1 Tax=Suhomyces tanzawaensis NRRL Y-17324 TaxID=984487 RepID=A0A1E4SQM0_9ASCO|nr:uncharacterized protein CANTADRAFT_24565 [Suhomyces tanzawaensis NRRL Y-17324]ODV81737.1 hypothetical protein CANTADRAFT_24565 [Suhomyces tanzawaensis NRRL Y-17324]
MGRRKIEIQPLTDDRNRTVTFVKRKAGLFKKAHELAVLCQVDLAVVIVGNNNKVYEFSSVDTNELIKLYQHNTSVNLKPQESKSPENYGNYKKKSYLHEKLTKKSNGGVDMEEDDGGEEGDSDYDSDPPEPKRAKRSFSEIKTQRTSPKLSGPKPHPPPPPHISMTNVPTFNQPNYRNKDELGQGNGHGHSISHKREDSINSNSSQSLRPVLRVQIPSDSKKGNKNKSAISDSALTISAVDTGLHSSSNGHSSGRINSSVTLEASMHNTSINNESSNGPTHAPPRGTSTQHGLGVSNIPPITSRGSTFSSFRSPDGTRKPTLPLIIQPKSQSSSPSSATAPPLPLSMNTTNSNNINNMFYTSLPQTSPSSAYPGSILPTPVMNQVYTQNNNDQNAANNSNAANKLRSSLINQQGGMQYSVPTNNANNGPNGNSHSNGEQTPMSGLPSRYVNDMFPSPSNFYAPQDWPNPPGMTPLNNNSLYFMNMLPSAGPTGPGIHQTLADPNSKKVGNQNRAPMGSRSENLPSPLHFMSNASFSNANQHNQSNNSNPGTPNQKR